MSSENPAPVGVRASSLTDDLSGASGKSLPASFRAAERTKKAMESKYILGEWTAEEYAQGLAKVIVRAGDSEWTIGATSNQWYRRENGGNWQVATPPSA